MIRTLLIATLAFTATVGIAAAQDSTPTPAATIEAAHAAPVLEPFIANYQVFNSGKTLGEATLQVVRQPPSRWRVDLIMHGTGIFRIAGINAEQSSVFDAVGETYRPLSQSTVRKTVFTRKQTIGIYDWTSRNARWQGDVKKTRTRPVALQDGDMSGLLINLAVVRDAAPGKSLHYRFVDDGRVREHHYVVANDLESVAVGDLRYNAMRVTRAADPTSNEETVIWVVSGVPTPIRMLQRENGEDTYDLRLVEYKGVQ